MEPQAEENKPNIMEKMMGRMMGGSTAPAEHDHPVEIEVGNEYGRTQFSAMPLEHYNATRGERTTLDASEYYVVREGYLREWVCMAQCNVHIQLLKNPMMKQMMETYRHDVCEPNLTEMRNILDHGGYDLPAEYNAVRDMKSVDELPQLETDCIDDRMLMQGHIFAIEAFMNRWNEGARLSHRADLRDAFLRNYNRANRWHLAAIQMAEKMQLVQPEPEVRPAH